MISSWKKKINLETAVYENPYWKTRGNYKKMNS